MYKTKNNHLQVVCGIIEKKGMILAAKRSSTQAHAGCWEFPGGKIHTRETPADAIIRELIEELGIIVIPRLQLASVRHTYTLKQIELIPFVCSIAAGCLYPLEHQELRWIDPNPEPHINLLPPDREILAIYRSYCLQHKND